MNTFDQPVSDFMSTPVETIHPDVSLKDAERHLEDGAYSCLAVTDPEGRVRGVHGLRVVDASIFPVVPSANTNFPTMMVAEKIADGILQTQTSARSVQQPAMA